MGDTNAASCSGLSSWSPDACAGGLNVCAVAIAGTSNNSNVVKVRLMLRKIIQDSCFGGDCRITVASPEGHRSIADRPRARWVVDICQLFELGRSQRGSAGNPAQR